MKVILASLVGLVTFTWYLGLAATSFPEQSHVLWIVRQEGLHLSGLLAISLMSLSMVLAIRPQWLEKPLGGLDRIYRLHKWSGILATVFAVLHWLIEMSDDILKALIGREGRLPKVEYMGVLEKLRELGEDLGEPALYLLLFIIVITLWRRFPYSMWRHLHRGMPVVYLLLAVHAAMLAPPLLLAPDGFWAAAGFWTQPEGLLLALFLLVGAVASVISLAGMIGRLRQVKATVVAIRTEGDVTELICRLDGAWKSYHPGQFAFINFGLFEGAHPFTIANSDHGDQKVTFFIKALGDFTKNLEQYVRVGQEVTIEGPYGRFLLDRCRADWRQIWVAGGVGVTPFLAWLESLQSRPGAVRCAELHYCTRNRETDPFVARLQSLSAALPGIELHIHSKQHGEALNPQSLSHGGDQNKKAEVWFCGPLGLAAEVRQGLKQSWHGRLRFHQEAFELR